MYCSNCGKEIDNSMMFCPFCGAKVGAGVAPQAAAPVAAPVAPQVAASQGVARIKLAFAIAVIPAKNRV